MLLSDSSFLPPDIRELFPGVKEKIYLNVAVRALVPRPTAEAAHAHIDGAVRATGDKDAYRSCVERCRERFAGLIGADRDEVAITKNVSEGLNLFAASLPWRPGDNVVFCPELEHPNNVFLWYNLRTRKGIEVRAVEADDGRMPIEALIAAMDERTALVTVPHVSFSPGFITDVRSVADAVHARGGLVLVDAAQSVGAIACHVEDLRIDALAAATQKSLLAFYGTGFLFVRRALAETLIPSHVARYGMDLGADAGETARSDSARLPYAAGARRFDLGNYNYLGASAAEASLSLIDSIGTPRIEAHLRALAARLASGLLELGLPVVGGAPGPHLAHIVAVGRAGGGHHDTADDPALNDLYRHLTSHGVELSIRKGTLRLSVGMYNDLSDIDRTLELVRSWVEAGKMAAIDTRIGRECTRSPIDA